MKLHLQSILQYYSTFCLPLIIFLPKQFFYIISLIVQKYCPLFSPAMYVFFCCFFKWEVRSDHKPVT